MTENGKTLEKSRVKAELDRELKDIRLTGAVREKIHRAVNGADKRQRKSGSLKVMRIAAACAAVIVLGSTTVYAGYQLLNRINVNDQTLPELDPMKKITAQAFPGDADEYGVIDADYSSYDEVNALLGGVFLDSDLEGENPYMQVNVHTDNKDYGTVKVENYLVGDTENYRLVEDIGRYNCDPGEEYASSVSLEVDYMLSSEQEAHGWDHDYLGYYQYLDSYVPAQGYKVNLIEDTVNPDPDFVTEKIAVFVADGVRYELKGRVPEETMKEIVDSMK